MELASPCGVWNIPPNWCAMACTYLGSERGAERKRGSLGYGFSLPLDTDNTDNGIWHLAIPFTFIHFLATPSYTAQPCY